MRFDLHMHTNRHSPDSEMGPLELLAAARAAGLDGVVITDHDYWWPDGELEELRAAEPALVVLAGMEVTALEGDVLCYGIRDPKPLKRGTAWKDLCRAIHAQGGVAVAAHPYRWGQKLDDVLSDQSIQIDGLEMMSKNMDEQLRTLTATYAASHPQYAQLGNSDSHDTSTLGCCHTVFGMPIRTIGDVVAAIRSNLCRAVPTRPK